jgi:hypothetical protein
LLTKFAVVIAAAYMAFVPVTADARIKRSQSAPVASKNIFSEDPHLAATGSVQQTVRIVAAHNLTLIR